MKHYRYLYIFSDGNLRYKVPLSSRSPDFDAVGFEPHGCIGNCLPDENLEDAAAGPLPPLAARYNVLCVSCLDSYRLFVHK